MAALWMIYLLTFVFVVTYVVEKGSDEHKRVDR